MSLDTKQRRGSAIGVSLPFRQWLAEPTGYLHLPSRLSLLRYVASVSLLEPTFLHGYIATRPMLGGKINVRPLDDGAIESRPSLTGRTNTNR
jgi:hypothetical protein